MRTLLILSLLFLSFSHRSAKASPTTLSVGSWESQYRYPRDEVAVVASMNPQMVLPQFIIQILKTAADQILKAINIALQRLQNKEIDETNKAKIIEAGIHARWLKDIVTAGHKMGELYHQYYAELRSVKEVIVLIGELRDLVQQEANILRAYRGILEVIGSGVFRLDEQEYIASLAQDLFQGAQAHVEDVRNLISGFGATMQDADRVTILKEINQRMAGDLVRMRALRNELASVAGVRTQHEQDTNIERFFER